MKKANKEKKSKAIILAIVLAIVVGSIYYLNSQKTSTGVHNPNNLASGRPSDYIKDEEAVKQKELQFKYAPELTGINGYINANSSLSIGSLKGKVVLVDFWTYTCINCIRTLPYLKAWDDQYRDDGLVIVGVHTPEFEFEKEYGNVLDAANSYGLKYPIVQDNNYATWMAYQNRFWPHKYLVDIDGFIRYDHIGEGKYEETEKKIQELLEERSKRMGMGKIGKDMSEPESIDVDFEKVKTPELYFGYEFARQDIGNEPGIQPEQIVEYELPVQIRPNVVYLEGTWKFNRDDAELMSEEGTIVLGYDAKAVNIVALSPSGSTVEVFVDTRYLNESKTGKDVEIIDGKSIATIDDGRLYSLVDYEYGSGLLELRITGKGFRINTFTFG